MNATLVFEGELAVVTLAAPTRAQPVLDLAMIEDLEQAVSVLEQRRDWQGLLVRGRDAHTFAAGADLDVLEALTDEGTARGFIERGQVLYNRFEDLRMRPKRGRMVAAVGGACAGGAYELCLALDCIVLADEPGTKLGLPEVKLGILPAWGGATRLPRRIGPSSALDIILKGRLHSAKESLRLGLVDRLCAPEDLDGVTRGIALGTHKVRHRGRGWAGVMLDRNPLAAKALSLYAQRQVHHATGGHYAAPLEIARIVPSGAATPRKRSLQREAQAAARLAVSPTAKNLLRLFRGTERAKKLRLHSDGMAVPPLLRMGVVGAGVMGAGIASSAARRGLQVRLNDTRQAALDHALRTYRANLSRPSAARPSAALSVPRGWMDRLDGTLELATLRHSEAVVEAIVEQLPAKRALLAQLEHTVAAECLLATNTSSLSVSDLQAGLHHPERVLGLHFFNPVDKMPLVEVVRGRHTSDAALTRACALALQLEKTPVVVADVPGFLVNRILGPYLDEALALLAGGVPAADLDAALKQFGMPMGPLALLDEVGFDVAAHAAQTLVSAYGSRMGSQTWLATAVQRGVLGKKTGRGFYLHAAPNGRPSSRTERAQLDPQAAKLLTPNAVRCELRTPDELATRLVAATCAEAFRCLEDRVTSSEEELDLAFVLGTGFAPFRGGPVRHARTLGLGNLVEILRRTQDAPDVRARDGARARFEPCALLLELAKR